MMGIILKLIANPVLRAIVASLLQWLLSECAGFVARYVTKAKPIVEAAMKATGPDGKKLEWPANFKLARDSLAAELKVEGIEYRDHFIDSTIQAAVGIVKAELEKKNQGQPK